MDPAHVIISDISGNPPMKSGRTWYRDRLHGKLVMYRALIIYRLNTRFLGDLYRFHVEKGALIRRGSRGGPRVPWPPPFSGEKTRGPKTTHTEENKIKIGQPRSKIQAKTYHKTH